MVGVDHCQGDNVFVEIEDGLLFRTIEILAKSIIGSLPCRALYLKAFPVSVLIVPGYEEETK